MFTYKLIQFGLSQFGLKMFTTFHSLYLLGGTAGLHNYLPRSVTFLNVQTENFLDIW